MKPLKPGEMSVSEKAKNKEYGRNRAENLITAGMAKNVEALRREAKDPKNSDVVRKEAQIAADRRPGPTPYRLAPEICHACPRRSSRPARSTCLSRRTSSTLVA